MNSVQDVEIVNGKKFMRRSPSIAAKSFRELPKELLAALIMAGRPEGFVAIEDATYHEAHSMRQRLQRMQRAIREGYTRNPPRLVDLACNVHWTVEDKLGNRVIAGLKNSPRFKESMWHLIGAPQKTPPSVISKKDSALIKLIRKLGKDYERRIDDVLKEEV